jgi:hypothetical protein
VAITAHNVTMTVDRMMALLIGSGGFTTRAYIQFWNAAAELPNRVLSSAIKNATPITAGSLQFGWDATTFDESTFVSALIKLNSGAMRYWLHNVWAQQDRVRLSGVISQPGPVGSAEPIGEYCFAPKPSENTES